MLQRLVEEELVAMGPNNNEAPQNNEGGDAEPGLQAGEDGNSSILSSLRKRIRLGRERHMEVGILGLTQSAFKTFISRILAPLLSRPLKPI